MNRAEKLTTSEIFSFLGVQESLLARLSDMDQYVKEAIDNNIVTKSEVVPYMVELGKVSKEAEESIKELEKELNKRLKKKLGIRHSLSHHSRNCIKLIDLIRDNHDKMEAVNLFKGKSDREVKKLKID